MSRALVLNATYEALCVVSTQRALILVLGEKAELIAPTGVKIHSSRVVVDEPSVVRLRNYVKVPVFPRIALSKRAIFARDGHQCQYCGDPAENVDHVIPRSRGGTHTWDNVVASCRSCNARKEDHFLSDTTFVLKKLPVQPRGRAWVISIGATRPEWAPYLQTERRRQGRLSA